MQMENDVSSGISKTWSILCLKMSLFLPFSFDWEADLAGLNICVLCIKLPPVKACHYSVFDPPESELRGRDGPVRLLLLWAPYHHSWMLILTAHMQYFLEWYQVLCVCWLRGTFPGSALAARDPSSLSSFYFSLRLHWHTVKTAAQAAIFLSFPPWFLSSPCQHFEMVLIASSLPDSWGLTPFSNASNICCTLFIK